ncbi:hypothetical protein [Variovorax sp. UMC13]|jgi:hypothetical protein|uniref:hypothetical protein n=1 Tax=Variovorax sp. UMC13 TaxID=1862326 RepID=UPI0016028E78|nr:hypothetical protein [Variovorax sp. UMC13]
MEVRLRWKPEILHVRQEILSLLEWQDRSNFSVSLLESMVKAGNAIHGPGTHWIESRERPRI